MRVVRASEISSYLYCQRAWWYQHQGATSENQVEMSGGSDYHLQHGKQVFLAGVLRLAGWLLMMVALVLLAVGITLQLWK